jgi:hypothetical protein
MIVAIHCNQDGVKISRFSTGGETVLHDPNLALRLAALEVWRLAGGEMSGHLEIDARFDKIEKRLDDLEFKPEYSRMQPVGSQSHTSRPQEGVAVLPFKVKRREHIE